MYVHIIYELEYATWLSRLQEGWIFLSFFLQRGARVQAQCA